MNEFQFTPTPLILLHIFIVLCLVIAPHTATAHSPDEQEVVPDSVSSSRPGRSHGDEHLSSNATSSVIRYFLDVAFSDTLWNSNFEDYPQFFDEFIRNFKSYTSPPPLKKSPMAWKYEWAYDYVFHPSGFPRQGVINKWIDEITVSIEWPESAPPTREEVETEIGLKVDPDTVFVKSTPVLLEKHSLVESHIKAMLPEIQRVTGLPTRFVNPVDLRQTARISLILQPTSAHADRITHLKMIRALPNSHVWRPAIKEHQFWGGVTFTPNHPSQVAGYLLPRSNNTIGMAICNVAVGKDDSFVRAQITECLARSLGLPSLLESTDQTGILTAWNQQLSASVPTGFSPYDIRMLKALYCSAIKPGMDKYQVIEALVHTPQCLN